MKLSKFEKKRIVYITAAVIFVLVCGVIYFGKEKKAGQSYDFAAESTDCADGILYEEDDEDAKPAGDEPVVVYVTGAVVRPGVYEVGGGMRVSDAVDAAGGFKDNAAKDYLNLAALVSDGEKITVPTKKEAGKILSANNSSNGSGESLLVNINTAAKDELMTLPGIGEAKADAIIAYRQENGSFRSVDELMQISGIKEGVYSKISEYITVN